MELITIEGKYRYSDDDKFEGLIVLFQFETLDTEEQYKMASQSILKDAKEKDIILVPFSHISNDVKPFDEAKKFSNEFKELCISHKKHGAVHLAPFGVEKELHLSSNGNALVKFRRFEAKEKTRIKSLYNDYYETYDKHMQSTGHYDAQTRLVKDLKKHFKGSTIDLGAGTGYLAKYLIEEKVVDFITVNDFSKKMIDIAREKIPNEKAYFSYFDASVIDVPMKYDTMISCNLFFYLNNRSEVIKKWKDLLSDNGKIILLEEYPFVFPKGNEIDNFSSSLKKLHKYLKPDNIIELFEENSFELIEKVDTEIDKNHSLYGYVFEKKQGSTA